MKEIEINELESLNKDLLIYSLQGYNLINKCTDLQAETCSLGNKSIIGFDDSFLEKVKNYVSDKLVSAGRKLFVSRLKDIKREYMDYFNSHYYLFMRSNELLKANAIEPVDLNILPADIKLAIDNDEENDDWIIDFAELCDKLRVFMKKTIDIADKQQEGFKLIDKGCNINEKNS